MWPRTVEISLACWLGVSPFIFAHPTGAMFLWINDLSVAALITIFSLLSFKRSLSRMHLLNLVIALWLAGTAAFQTGFPPGELPGALQNHVMVGVLLFIFALVPSHGEELPPKWREFYEQNSPQSTQRARWSGRREQ